MFRKFFVSILLVLGLSVNSFAGINGVFNLHLQGNDFLGDEYKKPDLRMALLLSKISNMAYKQHLSDIDKEFLKDNGFNNPQLYEINDRVRVLYTSKNININGKYKKLIILSFRGTRFETTLKFIPTIETIKDVTTDANAKAVPFYDYPNVKVHKGFHNYFKLFRTTIESQLISSNDLKNAVFVITGHSLGGAIAKLYAASLRERGVPESNVLVYTFGAPPVSWNDGGFSNRYNVLSGNKPFKIIESSNELDPIYYLEDNYVGVGSLQRTGQKLIPFGQDGSWRGNKGCNIAPTFYLESLGKVTFAAYKQSLPSCQFYAHKLGLYIYNIYKNMDMTSILEQNILDSNPPKDIDITFNEFQLDQIKYILSQSPFNKGVVGSKYDSSKLTKQERRQLLNKLKKLGIFVNFDKFGELGKNFRLLIKDIVDSKKDVLEIAKNKIDSTQSIGLDEYTKLAWGTILNATSAASDVYSYGASSLAKVGTKFPKIGHALVKLATATKKFGETAKTGRKLAKIAPHIKKIVDIMDTKEFKVLKALIDAKFTIDDNVKGILKQNEAGVDLIKNSIGFTGDLIKDKIGENTQNKIKALLLSKLVDIGVNIIGGTTEVLFTDKEIKKAFYELGDSLFKLIPIAGPFRSEWKLGQKVSDDIDKKPEVKEAWAEYFTLNQEIQEEIKVLGNATFIKRIDIVLTKALKEIKKGYVSKTEKSKDVPLPSLTFTLPKDANVLGNVISAKVGDTITFTPDYSAKDFIKEVNKPFADGGVRGWDGNEIVTITGDNVVYKLWYYDDSGNSKKVSSVTLDYDKDKGTFSFTMPIEHMRIVSMNFEHKEHLRPKIGLGFPFKWNVKYALSEHDSIGESDTDESYEKCIARGGTEIGCRVGSHRLDLNNFKGQYGVGIIIHGNYMYVADYFTGRYGLWFLKVYDISNIKDIKLIKSYKVNNLYSFYFVNGALYLIKFYSNTLKKPLGIVKVDVSDPSNFVFTKEIRVNRFNEHIITDKSHAYTYPSIFWNDKNATLSFLDITDINRDRFVFCVSNFIIHKFTLYIH